MRQLTCTRVVLGLAIIASLFAVIALTSSQSVKADINPQINFQGKLTNPDGTNVTNGTYSFVFSIYSVASGGSAIWTETQSSVTVTDGIFRVSLGSVSSLPGSVDFNSNSIYLGIKVGADAEMSPRVQFTAAPYAFNSQRLGGLTSSSFVQIGSSAVQTDASTNSLIFLNKTSTGSLLQLQQGSVDRFVVSNGGTITTASVNSASIADGTVSLNDLAGDSVNAAKIVDGSVGAAEIGTDVIDYSHIADALTLDAATTLSLGANNYTTNLNGTGDYLIQDNGTTVLSILDDGTFQQQNAADSATAFSVKDAAGVDLLQIDTLADRVYIGDSTADATGSLLVLDTKNTTGDPTGVVGGMYYNSNTSKFRCYQGTAWSDCLSPWITIRKTANQDVTNSATYTDDTVLQFSTAALNNYAVRFYICYTGTSATADYKGQFLSTTAATATKNVSGRYTATTTADAIASSAGVLGSTTTFPNGGLAMGTAATTNDRRIFEGYFGFQPATAGTLKYQFAQNTQTAGQSARTCANSFIEYQAL